MQTDQDQRERRRDERERDLIATLALIAPSPELLRRVVALEVPEVYEKPFVAIPIGEPIAAAPNL